jgi:hypothetical protein
MDAHSGIYKVFGKRGGVSSSVNVGYGIHTGEGLGCSDVIEIECVVFAVPDSVVEGDVIGVNDGLFIHPPPNVVKGV